MLTQNDSIFATDTQLQNLLDTSPDSPNKTTALRLAKEGFSVFPCDPANKRPLVKWRDKATADSATIGRFWRKWPDAMPGLPTGEANGLSVVDLDVGKDKDGLAAAKEIGVTPEDSQLVVRTGSGGLHLYFDHSEGVANSASKAGLDVRGEGGYVIAPGSISKAGKYTTERGDISEARLLGLTPFPEALKRPQASSEAATTPGECDLAEIKEALAYIPNDSSYDEWVSTLMALHHGTAGSSEGLALALGWCAGYPGFSIAEVREKWKSFTRAEGLVITSDTLFAEARKNGWQGITDDDFDDLDDTDEIDALLDMTPSEEAPKEPGGLTFLSPADCANSNPRPYIVKGLIAERDVGCIVGAPGVGKSVLAPALAYAVAQGREVHGRRVKQGRVFYVAAEDEHGMRGRVTALRMEHGDSENFTLVGGVSDLLSTDGPRVNGKTKGSRDLQALRKAVKAQRPNLIVIDTLAMAFPGLEENSAEAMGRVVSVARSLTRWGAAVILVHHDTKDGQQGLPRGHSLLNGALDQSIHLTKKEGIVRGRLTKNRNGACDVDLAFHIDGVEIGTDIDGDPETAALCKPLDAAESQEAPRLRPTEGAALDSIVEMIGEGKAVDESEWRQAARDDARISTAEKPDSRRRVVAEALRGLARKNVVRVSDGQIHLVEIGIDAEFEDYHEEVET